MSEKTSNDSRHPAWFYPAIIAGLTTISILSLAIIVVSLFLWGRPEHAQLVTPPPDLPGNEVVEIAAASETDPVDSNPEVDPIGPASTYSHARELTNDSSDDQPRLNATGGTSMVAEVGPADSTTVEEAVGAEEVTGRDRSPVVEVAQAPRENPSRQVRSSSKDGQKSRVDSREPAESSSSETAGESADADEDGSTEAGGASAQESRGNEKLPPDNSLGQPARVARARRPSRAELQRASEQFDQTHQGQLRQATTAEAKRVLADSLLEQAVSVPDAALRYVQLEQCIRLGAEAGDFRTALAAATALSRYFDTNAAEQKVKAIQQLLAQVEDDAQRHRLARVAVDYGVEAAEGDDFEHADSLYDIATNLARRLRLDDLQEEIQGRRARLKSLQAGHDQADDARRRIDIGESEAEAHRLLGEYLCLVKHEWASGCEHLIQGDDPILADLAGRDSACPRLTQEMVALADAWYAWGQGREGDRKGGAWRRAQYWYQKARPDVEAAQRQRLDDRLVALRQVLQLPGAPSPRLRHLSWLDDGPTGQVRTFEGHEDAVTALAVSTSGQKLASTGMDRTVRAWDLVTGDQISVQRTRTANLNGVAFTGDETALVANEDNAKLTLWPVAGGEALGSIPTSLTSPTDLAVSPGGDSLIWAARSRPPNIRIWSLRYSLPWAEFGAGEFPSVLDVSDDGRRLASGDSRGVVRVWELPTGVLLWSLPTHQDAVTSVSLSPDGHILASASFDQICVTELAFAKRLHTQDLPGTRCVAISPDARVLASGGNREEVYLWDLTSGEAVDVLRAEAAFSDQAILQVAFLPDPRGLVTGSSSGTIRLWRFGTRRR